MEVKTYPITRDQARDLHNGVCFIRDTMAKLEGVLNPEFISNFKSGFNSINKVCASIYEIIDQEHNALCNSSQVFAEKNDITTTLWSNYDIDSLDLEHGYPIGTILKSWDTNSTAEVKSPTWGGMWKNIDDWVKNNNDDFGNHIFIESLVYDKKEKALKVYFGS